MDFTDKVAVLIPPPSQDPSTYKPFPEEVERIVDEILSEEASLESSRDDDWKLTSTSISDESSSGLLSSAIAGPSSQEGKTPLRPFHSSTTTSTSKTRKQTNTSPQRRSRTARRTITVVNMASDSEEEDVSSKGGDDTPEENDVTSAMEYNDDVNSNAANLANAPTVPTPTQPDVVDGQDDHMSTIDGDGAEEHVIFSSVSESAQSDLLTFIGSHQFMLESVQPVRKSARRQFTGEVRNKALSAGMPDEAIYGLIHYVRRLYLEFAGVEAEKLIDFADDIPFGSEIDDEIEAASLNGKRKRSSKSLDKSEDKVKKRKKSKKRISKELDLSAQPLVEADTHHEGLSTVIVMQSPVKTEQSGANQLPRNDEEPNEGPDRIPESPVPASAAPPREDHTTDEGPDRIDLTLSDDEQPDTSDLHDQCSTCYGTSPEPDCLDYPMEIYTPAAEEKGKDEATRGTDDDGPVVSQQHDSEHGFENVEVPETPLISPLESSVETSRISSPERGSEGAQPEASSPQAHKVGLQPSSVVLPETIENKNSPSKTAQAEPSSSQPRPGPSPSLEPVQTTQSEYTTKDQPSASSSQSPNLEPTQRSHPENSAQAETSSSQPSSRPNPSLEPVQSAQLEPTTNDLEPLSKKVQVEASSSQLLNLETTQHSDPESTQKRLKSPLQDPPPQPHTDPQSDAESANGSSRDSISLDKKTVKNRRKRMNRRRNRIKRKSEVAIEPSERSGTPPQSPAGTELPATPVSQNSKTNRRNYFHAALSPDPTEWDVDF
ncbi:hypothetical protein N7540_007991 [Penicillium herquei]|nr:hypothetical protein N7540_007991 [Penicillium herquei]